MDSKLIRKEAIQVYYTFWMYIHNLLKFEWYQTRDSYNSNRKTALLWLDCTNNSAVNECIHGRNAVDNILHSVTRIYRSDCLDLVK